MFDINTSVKDYMSLVLTHQCNKACPFCVDLYRGREEIMTMSSLDKAIGFARSRGIRDMLLTGGEPTLHPHIVAIARTLKGAGFNLILTTNYSNPNVVSELDGIVDSFNISYYGQTSLPNRSLVSDVTLSTLIYDGHLSTQRELDEFIGCWAHKFDALKFSTLSICNEWTRSHQSVPYLDGLVADSVVLFDEIQGQLYRGAVIKRYDKIVNPNASQSFKCHVDGEISQSWIRSNIPVRVS